MTLSLSKAALCHVWSCPDPVHVPFGSEYKHIILRVQRQMFLFGPEPVHVPWNLGIWRTRYCSARWCIQKHNTRQFIFDHLWPPNLRSDLDLHEYVWVRVLSPPRFWKINRALYAHILKLKSSLSHIQFKILHSTRYRSLVPGYDQHGRRSLPHISPHNSKIWTQSLSA